MLAAVLTARADAAAGRSLSAWSPNQVFLPRMPHTARGQGGGARRHLGAGRAGVRVEQPLRRRPGPDAGEETRWLRMVIEQQAWAGGEFWIGNTDANPIIGVAKPQVLQHWDLTDGSWALRAELMTLVKGRQCSPTPELREPIGVPETWWARLRSSLAALAATRTNRVHIGQGGFDRRLEV